MTVNERIAEVLRLSGMKSKDFAVTIGISPPALTNICSGKRNPSGQTLELICQKFSIRKDWLINGSGEMKEADDAFREDLEREYGSLSDFDMQLIKAYMALPEETRRAISGILSDAHFGNQVRLAAFSTKNNNEDK